MPSSLTAPEGQLSRRDKFRAYMQAFNPTAPARNVIEAGLVFDDLHQSLYRNLASRADLEPGCQQLLVGGVGSGKTTELMLSERWLKDHGHVLPLYIDTSAETDLSSLNPGALLASLGLHSGEQLSGDFSAGAPTDEVKEKVKQAHDRIKEYAYGKKEIAQSEELTGVAEAYANLLAKRLGVREIPGKLKPPLPVLNRDIQEIRIPLNHLLEVLRSMHKDVVAIFDGLDRLLDPTKFWSVVYQDLRMLRELKVSVIATAPLSVLFGVGVGQSISDHFDRVHHLTVIASEPANTSLWSVLDKRSANSLLNHGIAGSICNYSGGVLRDLISLARDAAEEAYVSDRDYISVGDIEKVAHQLGNGYLRGLGPEAIKTLIQLDRSGSFDLNQPANIELLATRRVLEYSSTDFRVHPSLLSVIP
ncbi:MAG: hypothetical protein ACLQVM_18880 [Terriglobia bacterium]